MLTWDTNQICYSNPRRFYMAMEADRGEKLTLLPTVYEELLEAVYSAEARTYRRMCNEKGYEKRKTDTIMEQVGNAARSWLKGEVTRNDSAFARIGWAREDEYRKVAVEIPDICFKGGARSRGNDRRIVAQAIVERATLLVSDNLDTIRHDELNAWALREGMTHTPVFILTGNELAMYLEKDASKRGPLYLRWVAQACWPNRQAPGTIPTESIRKMIRNLDSAGLTRFASEADDALLNDEKVHECLVNAGQSLPTQARATEMRRVHTVRRAARQAGYER